MKLKSKLLALGASLMLSTTSASALAGLVTVDAGGGMWMSKFNSSSIKGVVSGTDVEITTDLKNDNSTYWYLRLDHFIPVVPNVRVEGLNFTTKGTATGSATILGQDLTLSNSTANITLNQIDYTAYWGIMGLNTLTLGVLDVEWGVNVKMLDGSIEMGTLNKAFQAPIPMAHLGVIVDAGHLIPVVPVPKITAIYRTIGGVVSDMDIKASWALPIPTPIITFGFELGYRQQTIDTSATYIQNLSSDIPNINFDYSGAYFGANIGF